MRPRQVEPAAIEDEGLAVAGLADEGRGGLEASDPRLGIGRPMEMRLGFKFDFPGPRLDLVEIHAGVAVSNRPQGQAHPQPGEPLRLGGPVAAGHLDEQARRRDVVAADDARSAVVVQIVGVLHRPAPSGCGVTKRSLSFFHRPGGACQAKTP